MLLAAAKLSEMVASGASMYVIDASIPIPKPGAPASMIPSFYESRIPGAKFFDINEVKDHSNELPHMFPDLDTWKLYMKRLQIKNNDWPVVCYDQHGLFSACRAWYMFTVFGKANVFVLDGGLPKWVAEGGATESGEVDVYQDESTQDDAEYNYTFASDLVKSMEEVRQFNGQILDARSAARFWSEAPEPRPEIRRGNIPNSKNSAFTNMLNEDSTFKKPEVIHQILELAGVQLDDTPIVHSCGSGVTA
jgi:thiosulfate/3-mercaptopyruvate sulfurtransferase